MSTAATKYIVIMVNKSWGASARNTRYVPPWLSFRIFHLCTPMHTPIVARISHSPLTCHWISLVSVGAARAAISAFPLMALTNTFPTSAVSWQRTVTATASAGTAWIWGSPKLTATALIIWTNANATTVVPHTERNYLTAYAATAGCYCSVVNAAKRTNCWRTTPTTMIWTACRCAAW